MATITYIPFIEDGETNSSSSKNIEMKEPLRKLTHRWFGWVIFSEIECKRVISQSVCNDPIVMINIQ